MSHHVFKSDINTGCCEKVFIYIGHFVAKRSPLEFLATCRAVKQCFDEIHTDTLLVVTCYFTD